MQPNLEKENAGYVPVKHLLTLCHILLMREVCVNTYIYRSVKLTYYSSEVLGIEQMLLAQSVGAVEHTNCTSAEE